MVIELNENQKEIVIEALSQYIGLFCAGELDVPESDIDECENVIEMLQKQQIVWKQNSLKNWC